MNCPICQKEVVDFNTGDLNIKVDVLDFEEISRICQIESMKIHLFLLHYKNGFVYKYVEKQATEYVDGINSSSQNKTTTVKITGHGDDVIMLEGDIKDEVYDKYIMFDDGTVICAERGVAGHSGRWKIERIKNGTSQYTRDPTPNDGSTYSDVVTLTGTFTSYCSWKTLDPTRNEIIDKLRYLDWREFSRDEVWSIYNHVRAIECKQTKFSIK